jgi:uncharacterized protein (DUF4415 family)
MPARKSALGSNLAKVDAHRITKEEYDEIPELNDEWFARAVPHIGGKRVSVDKFRKAVAKALGRPRSDNPKQSVTIRLDQDVIAHYRGGGPGWQTRINDALRRVAHLSASTTTKKAPAKSGGAARHPAIKQIAAKQPTHRSRRKRGLRA